MVSYKSAILPWAQRLARRITQVLDNEPRYPAALGAILLFIGLGVLHAIAVPPLKPIDERSHFSYALELRDGNLPEIETPVRADIVGLSRRTSRNTIWVSNHPPLFYAAQALVIGDVETADDVPEAFFRGRMLSIGFTALGLWFVFLCARELCQPRSPLPVLIVALTGTIPQFTHVMSLIHNDTLAFLTTTCALYAAILVLERGFSPGRYAALLLLTAACVATRSSGLMVAVATITAIAIASYRHSPGGWLRKSAFGAATVGGVLLAIAASSGWFYLRNIELYGDLTGASTLFEKFNRHPRRGVLTLLHSQATWWKFVKQLWGYYTGNIKVRPTNMFVPKTLGLAALLGLGLGAITRLRAVTREQLRALTRGRVWAAIVAPKTLNISMLVALSALTFLSIFVFHSRGGNAHVRYLFSILWVLVALFGVGLLRLGPRFAGFALTLVVLTHLLTLDAYVAKAHRLQGAKVKDLLLVSFERPEWMSSTPVLVMLIAVTAGLVMVLAHLNAAPTQAVAEADADDKA